MSNDESDGSDRNEVSTTEIDATQTAVNTDYKVRGKKSAPGGSGVVGHNTATSGESYGVEGVTDSSDAAAAGVRGLASEGSGVTYGVAGYNNSTEGFSAGVFGDVTADSNSNGTNGVYGRDPTQQGTGVYGLATAASGLNYGVLGVTNSADGFGVFSNGNSKTDGDHTVTGSVSVSKTSFSVFLSSPQTISGGRTRTTVEFDSVNTDDFGGWDGTNHRFTVQEPGDYHLDCKLNWQSLSSGTFNELWVSVGAGDDIYVENYGAASLIASKTFVDLSSGDTIQVATAQSDSSSHDLGSGEHQSYLTIHKVG